MAGRRSIVEFEKALAERVESEKRALEGLLAQVNEQTLRIRTLEGVLEMAAKDDDGEASQA